MKIARQVLGGTDMKTAHPETAILRLLGPGLLHQGPNFAFVHLGKGGIQRHGVGTFQDHGVESGSFLCFDRANGKLTFGPDGG